MGLADAGQEEADALADAGDGGLQPRDDLRDDQQPRLHADLRRAGAGMAEWVEGWGPQQPAGHAKTPQIAWNEKLAKIRPLPRTSPPGQLNPKTGPSPSTPEKLLQKNY